MLILLGSVLLFAAAIYAAFSTHGFLRLSFLLFAVWWVLRMGAAQGLVSFASSSPLRVIPALCIIGAALAFVAGIIFDGKRASA